MLQVPALLVMLAIPTAATGAAVPVGSVCPASWGRGGLTLEAGAVGYDVAGGVSGMAWGVDGSMTSSRVSGEVGYRRITLRQTTTSPDVLRASLRAPLGAARGWSVCGVAHAGGSRYVAEAGTGSILAGGLGLGLTRAATIRGATIVPYLEVRGLGARGAGTVLDIDMEETGLSLGVEAGATVPVGGLELRVTGSMDGFASGLGVTPYPARSLRVGLGYRF